MFVFKAEVKLIFGLKTKRICFANMEFEGCLRLSSMELEGLKARVSLPISVHEL